LKFVDSKISRGIKYKYSIQAIDKYGLVSEPTERVEIFLPELKDKSRK